MQGADAAQAPRDDMLLAEAALPQDLLDQLDARGVPGELVRHWATRESKVLAQLSQQGFTAPALPTHVREAACRCLSMLTDVAGLQGRNAWADGALMLDLFWLNGGVAACVETLPIVCTAIVNLLQKNNSCTHNVHPADLARRAVQLARWLASVGYVADTEILLADVTALENAILRALRWQVNLPSAQRWVAALCDRFDVLSRGLFGASAEWVRKQGMATAQMLILRHPASGLMSPRRVAVGLFGLFCVAARLVPLESLRPAKLSEQEWQRLFEESQCAGGGGVPACALPPARWESMLGLVRLASGAAAGSLQDDAHLVAEALRDMARCLRSSSAAQPLPLLRAGRQAGAPESPATHGGLQRWVA